MSRIGVSELKQLDIAQILADYYVLERLVADGSRSARTAQRKLESWAAPRLMRYIAAICGGEMRHASGSSGCEGQECNGSDSDVCDCCGEPEDYNHTSGICSYCGEADSEDDPEHDDDNAEAFDHHFEEEWYCDCFCPSQMCYSCEQAEAGELIVDIPSHTLEEWVRYYGGDGDGRSAAWREFLRFHDEHGSKALKWLEEGFEGYGWPGGYGGDSWAFIARVAYEYQAGVMSAHAFMDRIWTLQHNGGNIFDKMFDVYTLDVLLRKQAKDDYGYLTRYASPGTRDLWAIRPYVLSDSLDRSPEWLGREVPIGVDW